jgi:hypothetical protein
LKVQQEDKILPIKQKASASHDLRERVLDAGDDNLARRVARLYTEARVQIGESGQTPPRKLRPERALMVAQRYEGVPLTFALKGPLTREELELTEHFDTLHLTGLLPAKDVAVGDTWKVPNGAAQPLCAFDGLTAHDLVCKLEEVKGDVARVSIKGTAGGIALGAAVKLKIDADYRFDLKQKRLVELSWKQHDERDQGPISPALEFDVTINLKRTPLEEVTELNDLILAGLVPTERKPPESMIALAYADPAGRYELTHARDWHLVGRTNEHLVLRLLDRGDFVAQATVASWKKADPGKHLSPDEFKEAMAGSRGWDQKEVLDAKEVTGLRKGYWGYRLAAAGLLNGVSTLQYFYLIAGPQGEQTVISFTMTPSQAQKLETRDEALVRSLVYPAASAPAALPEKLP